MTSAEPSQESEKEILMSDPNLPKTPNEQSDSRGVAADRTQSPSDTRFDAQQDNVQQPQDTVRQYDDSPQPYGAPQHTAPQYTNASPYDQTSQYGTPQYAQSQYGSQHYGSWQYSTQPGAPLPQGTAAYGYGINPSIAPTLDQPYYGCPFPEACKRFFFKYATFTGRASRSEFWWAVLMYELVGIAIGIIFSFFSTTAATAASTIWLLACIVPFIAVGIRRLHDANRPGVWILLPTVSYAVAELVSLLWLMPIFNKIMAMFSQLEGSYMSISSQQLEYLGIQIVHAITTPLLLSAVFGLAFLISAIVLMVGRTNPAGVRFDARRPATGMPMNGATAYPSGDMQSTAFGQASYAQQQYAQPQYSQPQYGNPYEEQTEYRHAAAQQPMTAPPMNSQPTFPQTTSQQSTAQPVTNPADEAADAAGSAATDPADPRKDSQQPANPFDPRPEQ